LLLFLPGTNGHPQEDFPLAETASELGYHVISLMYPDTIAAQQICRDSSDPTPIQSSAWRLFKEANSVVA